MIVKACVEVVKRNERFIPPYGTGASFYLRPVMFGTTAGLGVKPSKDALLVVYGSPVGAYFKGGIKPMKVAIDREQDRAAPRGTGDVKVGGNYAASLMSGEHGHELGYASIMYLDATEHKYIEECGAANFFGIKNNTYITPKSNSVLPSITNKSLRQLAQDLGLKVEERHIPVDELPTFEECGACGTAAVISPIGSIYDMDTKQTYTYGDEVGRFLCNSIRFCRTSSTAAPKTNTTGARSSCNRRPQNSRKKGCSTWNIPFYACFLCHHLQTVVKNRE